jgi:hypothetical protein
MERFLSKYLFCLSALHRPLFQKPPGTTYVRLVRNRIHYFPGLEANLQTFIPSFAGSALQTLDSLASEIGLILDPISIPNRF